MARLNPTRTNYAAAAPTSTATLILAASVGRSTVLLFNNGNQTVFLGRDSTVLTTTGWPLKPGERLELVGVDGIYGITSTGTGDVRSIEETNPFEN